MLSMVAQESILEADLLEKIQALSKKQRAVLIEFLITDDPDVSISDEEYRAYWKNELSQRIRRYRSGQDKLIPIDEVIQSLRQQNAERTS